MEDLKDIDIIVATRIDNHERAMNAFLMYRFFKDHTINSKFIFVEDSVSPILQRCIPIEDPDKIYFEQNGWCEDPGLTHELMEGYFRKCRSYNIGIEKSDRKYLLFLDLDCILNPKQITDILNKIKKKRGFGVCYNGQPAYLNYDAKQYFAGAPLFSTLEGFYPDFKLLEVALDNRRRGFSWPDSLKYDHCNILGINAVGGCLLGMKKDFLKIRGFNENFAGWGYEDTEIISRIRILHGKSASMDWKKDLEPFYRCEGKSEFLFHFPHTKESVTSRQVVLASNKQESDKVEGMNRKELSKYIETWSWLK